MKPLLTLAIDIGSSSVRAGVYDGNANPIPRTAVKIDWSFTATPDGGSEMNAERAFRTVVAAIDAVLARSAKLKGNIEFVASCAFWHSLVAVDAIGKPTPVVLGWADTRSREYTQALENKFDETEVHNRTGAHFHSSYWPSKLLWLQTEFPDAFSHAARLLSFSDFLALNLFGEAATSVSMASGTGLFDIRKCVWDKKLLRYLKISQSMLPAIVDNGITFSLTKTYAERWPRLAGAKWFPAIGDGAADNIGSGCVTKEKAALMVGTSAAMRVAYEGKPPVKIPDGLWCYRIDDERVIIGGALSDGGNLYRWLLDNLKLPKNVDAEIARRRKANRPVPTFLPFLHGERSTGYNELATGGLTGLAGSHDATDILHAAMEAVARQLAEICALLNGVTKVREIVASGGALRESGIWVQIIADVLGRDLTINEAEESSLRGAVLLALEKTGKIESIENTETDK